MYIYNLFILFKFHTYLRIGTPLCIPEANFLEIGKVTSIQNNHKEVKVCCYSEKRPIVRQKRPIVRQKRPIISQTPHPKQSQGGQGVLLLCHYILHSNPYYPYPMSYIPDATSKETPIIRQKRPIVRQKRPIIRQKRPIVRQKRPIVRQKRPIISQTPHPNHPQGGQGVLLLCHYILHPNPYTPHTTPHTPYPVTHTPHPKPHGGQGVLFSFSLIDVMCSCSLIPV